MPSSSRTQSTPVRTRSQRIEALEKANQIRSLRAQLKKELRSGDRDIVEVLTNPPEYLVTAKVIDLLLVVPKFGRVKASRVLTRCRVSQSKTVGGLSDRQRAELIEVLEHRGQRQRW